MTAPPNKAVTFDRQAKFQWEDCPDFSLRPDEIEVGVALSTVNPIDAKRRYGYGRTVFRLKGADADQLALGNDFLGRVLRVGSSVIDLKPGDRVFGLKPPSKYGPHATRVVVKHSSAFKAHDDLSDEILVTLPYNTCTVLRALDSIGVNAANARGKKILVCGAGGGLGSIALELLRLWEAEVIAMYRSESNSALKEQQGTLDAVLNFAAWELDAALCKTLRAGAMGYATTVHPLLSLLDEKGLVLGAIAAANKRRQCRKNVPHGARYAWALFAVKPGDLEWMQDFARRTRTQPAIGIRAPMSQAHLAFDHVEAMRPGRALLFNNPN
jgi:D-arabinose 1-dehydrogenase-like Zn-dependent alcohol dehydrogenase